MPPADLRPRSTTELLDAAATLMRQHYLELVTTNALFTVPALVLISMLMPMAGIGTPPAAAALPEHFFRNAMAVLSVVFILGSSANATTVVIVSDIYLGREVTIGNAIGRAVGRIGPVLVAAVLQTFAVLAGFILFFPAFFLFASFFAAVNIVVVEDKNPLVALGRSRQLAKGSVLRILGVFFICGVILFVARLLLGMALGLALTAAHVGPQAVSVVVNATSVLFYPYFAVVTTLLYYDLRIRKEGLDLEVMVKDLTGTLTPA